MVRKKSVGIMAVVLLVGAFLGLIFLSRGGFFPQSILPDSVVQPIFANVECRDLSQPLGNGAGVDFDVKTNSEEDVICGSPDIPGFIPGGCGVTVTVNKLIIGGISAGVCDGTAVRLNDASCRKFRPASNKGSTTFLGNINFGQKVIIDVDDISPYSSGDVELNFKGNPYGLVVTSPTAQLIKYADCTTSNLRNVFLAQDKQYTSLYADSLHLVSGQEPVQWNPGTIQSYITGAIQVYGSIQRTTINGRDVVVVGRGLAYPVKQTSDGLNYADNTQPITDPSIECVPDGITCGRDARFITSSVGQSCGLFNSPGGNYAPVSTGLMCRLSCSNGVVVQSSDCVDVTQPCPASAPVFDQSTGQCVSAVPLPQQNKTDNTLRNILIGLIIIFVMVLFFMLIGRRNGGGSNEKRNK